MEDERCSIKNFARFLNKKVQDTVEQNVDLSVLGQYKRILVLQSASAEICNQFLKELCEIAPHTEILILGTDECERSMHGLPFSSVHVIPHNKRFADDDIEPLCQIVGKMSPDAAIYFNNFVHNVDFSNVAHVIGFIADCVPIYSYSYSQQELNRHLNIPYQIYGEIVFKDMVLWYQNMS